MSLIIKGVTKRFDTHLVINGISLNIDPGELFVLIGSSGSGKSTLLRLVAGLLLPESGSIEIQGRDVTDLPPQRRDIGFVFQNYALFRHMTVRKNIEFGLRIRAIGRRRRMQRSEELLDLVGLTGFGDRYPQQLSGGQRQRVALARALAHQPTLLLLDEPFGALDLKIRGNLRRSLREIQRQLGITAVLVTHDQEEAFELGDRIGVMEHGRLVEVGTPEKLYHRPDTEYVAKFIGGGNVLVGRYERGHIRSGDATIPLPANSPSHTEGAPVRFLFRPETVRHQIEPFVTGSGIYSLGLGRVKHTTFAGAVERIQFELENLDGVRPAVAAVAYGQRYASIEAVQPSLKNDSTTGARPANVSAGELRWIGIAGFHVLQPTSLRILALVDEPTLSYPGLSLAAELAFASHGILNLLDVCAARDELASRQKLLSELRESVLGSRAVKGDCVIRVGDRRLETLLEIQTNYYDVVVVPRAHGPRSAKEGFGLLSRTLLTRANTPVLIGGETRPELKKILICTAGGEQGKHDLKIGARLARHTGAFVCVLHVRRDIPSPEQRVRLERHLAQAKSTLSALAISHEIKIREGDFFEQIVQEAAEGNFDLVVLGVSTPGAKGMTTRPHDFTNRFVESTKHPVLIVPQSDG